MHKQKAGFYGHVPDIALCQRDRKAYGEPFRREAIRYKDLDMNKEEYSKYFEILELTPDASLSEVRKAYLHLKELYSKESIVTLPIEHEISEDLNEEILQQIEDAYLNLLSLYKEEDITPERDIKKIISDVIIFNGPALREIRERLSIDLRDVALVTKIQMQHLENIELEEYDSLPVDVYVRGYIASYAKYLSLDPKKVADDYMNEYYAWKEARKAKKRR